MNLFIILKNSPTRRYLPTMVHYYWHRPWYTRPEMPRRRRRRSCPRRASMPSTVHGVASIGACGGAASVGACGGAASFGAPVGAARRCARRCCRSRSRWRWRACAFCLAMARWCRRVTRAACASHRARHRAFTADLAHSRMCASATRASAIVAACDVAHSAPPPLHRAGAVPTRHSPLRTSG